MACDASTACRITGSIRLLGDIIPMRGCEIIGGGIIDMNMIEKMARAMAALRGFTDGDCDWQNYTDLARTALQAMLEPSEGMLEYGECGPYPHDEEHPGFGDPMPRQIYVAMIQAALEEK